MGVLKNAKHERFAQGVAKGKTAIDAYVSAGYEGHDASASRLRNNPKVKARIEEILAKAARKVAITVETLTEQLAEDRECAREWKQASPMVAASKLQGQLHKLLDTRVDVRHTVEIDDLTLAQKRDRALALANQLLIGSAPIIDGELVEADGPSDVE